MSTFYQRGADKRRDWQEMRLREQEVGSVRPESPKQEMEQEKRIRREIANSNERRRMQSINAGFQSLKLVIPHQDGEKLSKAAILQHTTEYILRLESDRRQLMSENGELKQMLQDLGHEHGDDSPPPKRKKRDTESSDEGISMSCTETDYNLEEAKRRDMLELRSQLEQERRRCLMLERRLVDLENKQNDVTAPKWIKEEVDYEASQNVPRPECTTTPPPSPPQTVTSSSQSACVPASNTQSACVPAASSTQPACVPTASTQSLARRNLDTIMEAIRHLEGEHVLVDTVECERSVPTSCACVPHNEESGTESSYDQEDALSDGSIRGSESPSSSSQMECETSDAPTTTFTGSATVHMTPPAHILHQALPLLATNLTKFPCSPFLTTPLQLLPHPIPMSVATPSPQLPALLTQSPPSVVVMQQS